MSRNWRHTAFKEIISIFGYVISWGLIVAICAAIFFLFGALLFLAAYTTYPGS